MNLDALTAAWKIVDVTQICHEFMSESEQEALDTLLENIPALIALARTAPGPLFSAKHQSVEDMELTRGKYCLYGGSIQFNDCRHFLRHLADLKDREQDPHP